MRRFLGTVIVVAIAGAALAALRSGDPGSVGLAVMVGALMLLLGTHAERLRRSGVDLRATRGAIPGLRRLRRLSLGRTVLLAAMVLAVVYAAMIQKGR